MFRILTTCVVFAAITAVAPGQERRDPQAVAVAEAQMDALGSEAWEAAHFVRFDFKVGSAGEWRTDRSHLWDKWTGRYRLEQPLEDGQTRVVLFNVNSREGDVYVDGEALTGEAADEALQGAYGAFINDMYWLAMPHKWLDAGVNLKYVGEQEYDGEACDVVELTFGDVGLTPGDRYQAYVSKADKIMIHWEYTLQSGNTGSWDWDYLTTGGAKLAATHTNPDGMEINMGAVEIFEERQDAFFTDPAMSIR